MADTTTSANKHIRRPTRFWVLLVLALALSSLIAWDGYVTSPLGQVQWMVSLEKYWLQEFTEWPGVRAYAETLLKADQRLFRHEMQEALKPPYYPFFYFIPVVALLGVAVLGNRRNLRWQYAAIWFALAAVACAIASKYMQPKWL
jgi:hypothetical protein